MPAVAQKPQSISGVSASYENVIETLYPSIACTSIGRFLNDIYDSIPARIWGLKVSNLLFCLPSAPLGALTYLLLKVVGSKYVVTNRAVRKEPAMGLQLQGSIALDEIASVYVDESTRMEFFRSADVQLVNAANEAVLTLAGVPYPDRFRQVILEARDARRQVASSMKTIAARH